MSKPAFEDVFEYKTGRRNRKSFLIFMAIQIALSFVFFAMIVAVTPNLPEFGKGILGVIVLVFSLGLLMSQFCVMAQRCRDIGYSGLWVMLNFVPFIAMVFQLVLLIMPGQKGQNRFGEDPLGQDQEATSPDTANINADWLAK